MAYQKHVSFTGDGAQFIEPNTKAFQSSVRSRGANIMQGLVFNGAPVGQDMASMNFNNLQVTKLTGHDNLHPALKNSPHPVKIG